MTTISDSLQNKLPFDRGARSRDHYYHIIADILIVSQNLLSSVAYSLRIRTSLSIYQQITDLTYFLYFKHDFYRRILSTRRSLK